MKIAILSQIIQPLNTKFPDFFSLNFSLENCSLPNSKRQLEDEVVSIGDSGSDNDTDDNRHSSSESYSKNGCDHPSKKPKTVCLIYLAQTKIVWIFG